MSYNARAAMQQPHTGQMTNLRIFCSVFCCFNICFSAFCFADLPPLPPSQLKILAEPVAAVKFAPIQFESGSSFIPPTDLERLRTLSNKLADLSIYIAIEAYTDRLGRDEANLELSIQRADAAKSALLLNPKISESQILSFGYGESKAQSENGASLASDRRLEITIWTLKDSTIATNDLYAELKARGLEFTKVARSEPKQPRKKRKKTTAKTPKLPKDAWVTVALTPGLSVSQLVDVKSWQHTGVGINVYPFSLGSSLSLALGFDYQIGNTQVASIPAHATTLRPKLGLRWRLACFETSQIAAQIMGAYAMHDFAVKGTESVTHLTKSDPQFEGELFWGFRLAKYALLPGFGVQVSGGSAFANVGFMLGLEMGSK